MKNLNDSDKEKQLSERHEPDAEVYRSPLPPNLEKYREHLKRLNLSDEAQDEMLRTLWRMMEEFVDVGWGKSSVQLAMESPGESSPKGNRVDKGGKK